MEEVKKRKRGRPRKVKLPDEVLSVIDIVKETETKEAIQEPIIKKKEGEWDVPIGAPIAYFDKNLSYEVTGYKPIDDTHGLDFNPSWFTEARDNFLRTGHYCLFLPGSKLYRDFWQQEYVRCRTGMTVNGYTLTGNNYFFLNYYQLPDTNTERAGTSRAPVFPSFLVYLYEFFHYFELCKICRKNVNLMKSRGIGFSEINASISANQYSCFRNSMCIITASNLNYTEKTLEKVWNALTFLNNKTDGGFFKLRQALDTAFKKRASFFKMVNGLKVEDGWMSQIEGIVADDDSKIRGDRADLLIFEEAGHNKNLRKSFIKGEALVSVGGNKFGIIMAGGTGGDAGPQMEGLHEMYYNPDTYDVLPFKHNYTLDGETIYSGYFIPAYIAVYQPGFIDKRGYCDLVKAKAHLEAERRKRASSPKALVDHCAEYCWNAEEAFALEGTNKFNKVLITNQLARIRMHKNDGQIPVEELGTLDFIFKNGKHTAENVDGVRWIKDNKGLVHIIEHPLWLINKTDENGQVISKSEMRNLYVAGIDGIDIGQDQTSDYTKDPSKFSIVIKRRAYGLEPPQYVAYYMFRPDDLRDAYRTAIKLLMYYNCRCNIEATRLSMLNWARDRGWINYFMKRPRKTYPEEKTKASNTYGTPATVAIIEHQTDLIKDYVEDYCDLIWFPEFLELLNRYSNENKGKFDIVAAMGMCELADEELSGITPSVVAPEDKSFKLLGWYTDEKGYKHFGVIPNQPLKQARVNTEPIYDNSRNRTSDPRLYYGRV